MAKKVNAQRFETAIAQPLETPEREAPNYGEMHDSKMLDRIHSTLVRIELLLRLSQKQQQQ